MAFNHENLKVYQRTLPFNVKVGVWTGQWDGKHAICDQLSRAAGSILENIAMASAAYSSLKLRSLDYAIGSSLECAACLDLADIKRLLDPESAYTEKEELSQILRMAVFRRLDELLTSMILNIAEGNGRFSNADQARFLSTSHESAVKLAARLDLCVTQDLLPRKEVAEWKALLERVAVMTASMIAGIQP